MIDPTTKKGALFLLVQTYILVAGSHRGHDPLFRAKFANATLAGILALDEDSIPDDVERACEEYIYWQDARPMEEGSKETHPRPSWFNPPVRREPAHGYIYPWENIKKSFP